MLSYCQNQWKSTIKHQLFKMFSLLTSSTKISSIPNFPPPHPTLTTVTSRKL